MRRITRSHTTLQAQAAQQSVSTAWRDAFWNTDDAVLYTLRYLSLLDLISLTQTNSRLRRIRKALLKGRISRYTSPFFAPSIGPDSATHQLNKFFTVLRNTASWIVGSVALAAVSVLSDPGPRTNLNIITSYENRDDWSDFFEESGFRQEGATLCRGAYAHEGGRLMTFVNDHRPKKTITITTSNCLDITKLFLVAPNTVQQVAVGAHHIITPYPRSTSAQEGIHGWRPDMNNFPAQYAHADWATFPHASPFPDAVTLHASSESLASACGELCPALWRTTLGGKNIAHWYWGGFDGRDHHTDHSFHALVRSRVHFRTGVVCRNDFCEFSSNRARLASERV